MDMRAKVVHDPGMKPNCRGSLTLSWVKEHDYAISSTCYWSDSTAVIGQIRGESKRHPAFTANRLSEILDASEPQ